ncbi:MAG: hypothetical protein AAGE03_04670 [Pseudomonadota bacterium]
MSPSYLTHSPIAWISVGLMVAGLALKYIVAATGLASWLIPVGYFIALAAAGVMFVGWVRWKVAQDAERP